MSHSAALVLQPRSRWPSGLRTLALLVSFGLHALIVEFVLQPTQHEEFVETWVEMEIVEQPPPPPPPEPEPAPEPTPEAQPIPEPEPMPFEELQAAEPPPEAPPPKRLRRVHGLSASSFSTGSGTGLSVRAGTTLSVAASDETLSLDEASESVAITEVTTVPRLKYKPALEVPDTVKEAEVEGVVQVRLVLNKEGRVSSVTVVQGIGHGADEACADAWRRARFKPATRNGESIGVTDYPQRCVIRALD